jgi:hypothetical protein
MVSHRVATSRVHPPGRLQPRQDAYTLGRPLRPSCHAMRPPTDRWGAGPAPRSPGAGDGSAWASPVRLRRVLDPLHCARRDAAPLEGGPPERCDERLVAMGRLSHACLLHTTLGVCRTPPLHYPVSRSFPCWDISPHRCYTLRQTGSAWAAYSPRMHETPAKEADDGYRRRPTISA